MSGAASRAARLSMIASSLTPQLAAPTAMAASALAGGVPAEQRDEHLAAGCRSA